MILNEEQIASLRERLKVNTIPKWKSLPGLTSQINALKSVLVDVFLKKRNEAILILGPSGCLKHLLIDYCFSILEKENMTSAKNVFAKGEFIRINLDGNFIESDDDAFRVIARNLTSSSTRNRRIRNAQYKNMEFLEIVLQEAQICDVPLVFVLDNFSKFCHHSKQTLLYTLLDMCSSYDVQICIIGIDRDCTITELLEKRIQSRFSQKQIIINYPTIEELNQYTSSSLFLYGTNTEVRKWNSAIKRFIQNEQFVDMIRDVSHIYPISYHILPTTPL